MVTVELSDPRRRDQTAPAMQAPEQTTGAMPCRVTPGHLPEDSQDTVVPEPGPGFPVLPTPSRERHGWWQALAGLGLSLNLEPVLGADSTPCPEPPPLVSWAHSHRRAPGSPSNTVHAQSQGTQGARQGGGVRPALPAICPEEDAGTLGSKLSNPHKSIIKIIPTFPNMAQFMKCLLIDHHSWWP